MSKNTTPGPGRVWQGRYLKHVKFGFWHKIVPTDSGAEDFFAMHQRHGAVGTLDYFECAHCNSAFELM